MVISNQERAKNEFNDFKTNFPVQKSDYNQFPCRSSHSDLFSDILRNTLENTLLRSLVD